MGTRLFGWYPSGNGMLPLTNTPTTTVDIGAVKVSSNIGAIGNTSINMGAMMCALFVASGNNTTGLTWVPLRWDWLK
jgi:hypothetical protein